MRGKSRVYGITRLSYNVSSIFDVTRVRCTVCLVWDGGEDPPDLSLYDSMNKRVVFRLDTHTRHRT